jgi:HAD superfamily hydrolase (TIGR01509 family)
MSKPSLAILWDMDGTIIDTKASHFITWQTVLHRHGYDLDRDVYDANFGRNTRTILPLFLGFDPDEALLQTLLHEKETLFREVAPKKAALIPGVKTWLREARANHIPQAIASSGSLKNIRTMMESFDLIHYFDALVPGHDLPAKPEPDVFLLAAKALDTPPESCLVIEDAIAGLQAARKAGMHCIAVATSHAREKLAFADLVIDHFEHPLMTTLNQLGFEV